MDRNESIGRLSMLRIDQLLEMLLDSEMVRSAFLRTSVSGNKELLLPR